MGRPGGVGLPVKAVVSSEDGGVMVLMAVVIAVLLMFAAVAVDLAYQFVQRRHAQGAVDTTVLAASVTFFQSGADLQATVDDVLLFAEMNTTWSVVGSDWQSCSDGGALSLTAADLGLTPSTACVSFNDAFDEIRVRLPEERVTTFFAGIIGVDTLPVYASAQATINPPEGARTPPFVALSSDNAGDQICLRTSSSGADIPGNWLGNGPGVAATQLLASDPAFTPDPCDDLVGASQFFGTLAPYYYKDRRPPQPDLFCRQADIDINIADGIDHNLSIYFGGYSSTLPEKVEGDGCPQGPVQAWPNTMYLQTGFTAQLLKCGLLSTRSGTCSSGPIVDGVRETPRFQRGFYAGSGAEFAGEGMENIAPWTYLDWDTNDTVPGSCVSVATGGSSWDYFDYKEEFVNCLTDWAEGVDDSIFSEGFVQSARFAIIPQTYEDDFSTSPVHFEAMVPIFLYKLYQAGNRAGNPDPLCFSQGEGATGNSGWYWHEAGQPFDCGRSNQNVDRAAAYLLDCGMLEEGICVPDGDPESPGGTLVYQVLLSR